MSYRLKMAVYIQQLKREHLRSIPHHFEITHNRIKSRIVLSAMVSDRCGVVYDDTTEFFSTSYTDRARDMICRFVVLLISNSH